MRRNFLVALCLILAATSEVSAKPGRGSWELHLGSSGPSPDVRVVPTGIYVYKDGPTAVGLSTGFGYFFLAPFELGLRITFETVDFDWTRVGVAPFLKLLLAGERLGLYLEFAAGGSAIVRDNANDSHFAELGFGVGLEGFLTRTWAVRAGPRYVVFPGGDETLHVFGVDWSIAAYF